MALTDPAYLRGIAVLEQLLAALTPKETVLLPNYPNPFNPETWIPYHLSHAADVQVTIYDAPKVRRCVNCIWGINLRGITRLGQRRRIGMAATQAVNRS